jgi:two-component system, OmpR family, alkaline phosphatase synthesis response regulator PhoP
VLETGRVAEYGERNGSPRGVLRFGPLRIDLRSYTVELSGELLPLTRIEFDLLELLLRGQGRVIAYRELAEKVLHGRFAAETATLRVHVSHLRAKLRSARGCVVTVRARGLAFDPRVLERSSG